MAAACANGPAGGVVQPLPVGSNVEYYSQSQSSWIPAVVLGFNGDNTYRLDVHVAAAPQKVRPAGAATRAASPQARPQQPPRQDAGRISAGDRCEYYSTSHGGWVPTICRGYDERNGAYITDIQPIALPSKVRPVAASAACAGGAAPAAAAARAASPAAAARSASPVAVARASTFAPQQAGGASQDPQCGLCLKQFGNNALLGPDCGHLFCEKCLRSYILGKDFLRQPVNCPQCSCKIASSQVQHVVGDAAFKDRQAQMAREDEELALRLAASGGNDLCPRCGKEAHDGYTCEEQARRKQVWEIENKNADKAFADLMAQEQWRKCPVCSCPSECASGCYFMQCRSEKCRKHTYWCYICGLQMKLDDHYTHYPRGPYVWECNTPAHLHVPLPAGAKRGESQGAAPSHGASANYSAPGVRSDTRGGLQPSPQQPFAMGQGCNAAAAHVPAAGQRPQQAAVMAQPAQGYYPNVAAPFPAAAAAAGRPMAGGAPQAQRGPNGEECVLQ